MPLFKKPNTTEKILKQVQVLVDIVDQKPIAPSTMKTAFKTIAEEVAKIPLEKRDEIAEKIKEFFDRQIMFRRKWQREEENKIKALLKEISYLKQKGAKIPPEKRMRARQIDATIRMYRARIYTIKNIEEQILITIREAQTSKEIMKNLINVNQTLMAHLQETEDLLKEYEEVVEEAVEPTEIDNLMKTYLEETLTQKTTEEEEEATEIDELMKTYLEENSKEK